MKNYGPIATKLHFSKSYFLRPWLLIKLCGKLEPGDTGRIDVTFSPTPQEFKEVEQNLELMLYLEVTDLFIWFSTIEYNKIYKHINTIGPLLRGEHRMQNNDIFLQLTFYNKYLIRKNRESITIAFSLIHTCLLIEFTDIVAISAKF